MANIAPGIFTYRPDTTQARHKQKLRDAMKIGSDKYQKALIAFYLTITNLLSEKPPSDGICRMWQADKVRRVAFEEYEIGLVAFAKFFIGKNLK